MIELYIKRLTEEWNKHGQIIIAVDFDDTVRPWKLTEFNYDAVLDQLRRAKKVGALIVPFTAREEERWQEIIDFFREKEIEIEPINQTPEYIPAFGRTGKIYANIFLDDRAGLEECMLILEESMNRHIKFMEENNEPDKLSN